MPWSGGEVVIENRNQDDWKRFTGVQGLHTISDISCYSTGTTLFQFKKPINAIDSEITWRAKWGWKMFDSDYEKQLNIVEMICQEKQGTK